MDRQATGLKENIGRHRLALSDLQLLILAATLRFLLPLLTNNQYGFHQDAMAFLADSLHLDWGYIAYPPLNPSWAASLWPCLALR